VLPLEGCDIYAVSNVGNLFMMQ